jgi:hypothetical protein
LTQPQRFCREDNLAGKTFQSWGSSWLCDARCPWWLS